MDAKELKIGNIVRNKEGIFEQVVLIYGDGFINGYDGNAGLIPDDQKLFEGIQFNNDWAVLFGYECSQELAIGFNELEKLSFKVNWEQLNEMKVHEVQNLFFALNEKDLEYTIEGLNQMNMNRD